MTRLIKVLIEQQVIPPYRVPFFSRLAEQVDLLVLASEGIRLPGINDVTDGLSFRTIRSKEVIYRGFTCRSHYVYHKDIISALRKHSANVYITNSIFTNAFAAYSNLRLELEMTNVSMVTWGCEGYDNRDFKAVKRKNLQKNSLKYLLRHPSFWPYLFQGHPSFYGVKMCNGFLTYSSLTAKYWQQVWDIPISKITIAHNAIDTDALFAYYRNWLNSGLQRSTRKIIFVGRITAEKKIDFLLRAFRRVKEMFPDIALTLVGEGPARLYLERYIDEMQLKDVEFLGEIQDQTLLANTMCSSSLFVMPGLGGLGINSAMACGLPVICSEADGTELDLVQEGENGWFFISGDEDDLLRKLITAFSDPQRLEQYGKESARRINNVYNLENMVNSFVDRIELSAQVIN